MKILMLLFVAAAGALNTLQSGTNAQLARSLERPWLVGLLISLSTACVFAVGVLLSRQGWPAPGRISSAPWWAWIGGLCGAAYVVATLFVSQELGGGLFIGMTVTAGIVTSILLDHFGLVGLKQHTAGWGRIGGALLMIAGLALVARF